MNKKFSTLVASVLLAGGAFSNAYAENFSELAGNGKFYKIERTFERGEEGSTPLYGWQKNDGSVYLTPTSLDSESNASLWMIVKNADNTISLVSLEGEILKVGEATKFTVDFNPETLKTIIKGKDFNQLKINATDVVGQVAQKNDGIWKLAVANTNFTEAKPQAFDAIATSLATPKAAGVAMANKLVFRFETADAKTGLYYAMEDPKNKGTYSFVDHFTGAALYITGESETENDFRVVEYTTGKMLQTPSGKYVALNADGEFSLVSDMAQASLFAFTEPKSYLMDAQELSYYEKDGFSVTIKGQNETTAKWTVDLQDNFFTGHLTPMKWNGTKFVKAAADAEVFYVKNGNGKYVVALANLAEGHLDKAYAFAEVSEEALRRDIVKKENKYYAQFAFSYNEKAEVTNVKQIELIYVYHNNEWAGVAGRLDFKKDSYLAVQPYGAQTINLKPIQIKLGSDQIADWHKVLAPKFFTVEDITKDASRGFKIAFCDYATWEYKEKAGNVLETQWALTFDEKNNQYVFTNRENLNVSFTLPNALYLTKADYTYNVTISEGEDLEGVEHFKEATLVIKPVDTKATDGYMTLPDVKNHKFNIGYWSGTYNDHAWFTENHAEDHKIGLDTDQEAATVWTAFAFNKEYKEWEDPITYETKTQPSDSIYVISTLHTWDAKKEEIVPVLDTLKVVAYAFENEYSEWLTGYDAYTADENNYSVFTLREDKGHYNLRVGGTKLADNKRYSIFANCGTKTYAGDAANGILSNTNLYERTENDLFDVVATEKPMYRRLANDIDTVSIFRDENASQLLFEDKTFLGLKNENQFEFAPAMLAVAAYAPAETYRPQYMLAVGVKDIVEADTVLCDAKNHKHATKEEALACPHTLITPAYVNARFLVNLKDTAIVWHKANKHNAKNPYTNTEKYYRLGFVEGTYRNDSLIVAQDNNRLFVGGENFNQAKFAFKYVDQEAGSFKIETADFVKLPYAQAGKQMDNSGWIKWMNGVVVVIENESDADVFNMNEDEHRNPTSNEEVAVSEVSVVAVDGAVVVKGAAGKTVVISNILGQTIANTVIASDNETIAVPAGVVVVVVEGEEAVKAIVK